MTVRPLWSSDRLPDDVSARIEKGIRLLPSHAAQLSEWDWCAAALAGVAGALVDALFLGFEPLIGGSPPAGKSLSGWLRDNVKVPGQDGLEAYTKTAFDRVAPRTYDGPRIPGMSPQQHRLLTLGHDPLFGLVFGILDTARGTMTGIDSAGRPFARTVPNAPDVSWAEAPLVWLAHLLSDVGTRQGLPAPGWGLTQLLQFGDIKGRKLAETARLMYAQGFDLRHLASGHLATRTTQLLVGLYTHFTTRELKEPPVPSTDAQRASDANARWLQRNLETSFRTREVEGRKSVLLAVATGVLACGNLTKILLAGGSPLAVNVDAWRAAAMEGMRVVVQRVANRNNRELQRLTRSRATLDERWADLLD